MGPFQAPIRSQAAAPLCKETWLAGCQTPGNLLQRGVTVVTLNIDPTVFLNLGGREPSMKATGEIIFTNFLDS